MFVTFFTPSQGCCSFMEDVGDLNDICVDHGDSDSAGEEERETQYTAGKSKKKRLHFINQ